jgi:peptide-methionine (R)-S-oxide reductase
MQKFRNQIIKPTSHNQEKYSCTNCNTLLLEAAVKFDVGSGFPSFWAHVGDHVRFNPLDTYGRERIQLLCDNCKQHLGHLFEDKRTPSGLRYCINAERIK